VLGAGAKAGDYRSGQLRDGRAPAVSAKKLKELQQQSTPAGAARK